MLVYPEAFVSDIKISQAVSRAVAAGQVRKIGSRLYTRNFTDTPESIVRRNLWHIVGGYFPGGLIADRTALENAPAQDGSVCLITTSGQDISLPGITLRPRRGVAPLEEDRPFVGGLFLSSTARSFLENMCPSRRRRNGMLSRTLRRQEIEERLETFLRRSSVEAINTLRDRIRSLAVLLNLIEEGRTMDSLIGSLLGTHHIRLKTPIGRARSAGRPFDPDRLPLFESLHSALRNVLPTQRPEVLRKTSGVSSLCFFEAYFSNFIEGTEFAIEEAADIIFSNHIPKERPMDAHDILGTWRLVSDRDQMCQTPQTPAELKELLCRRHAAIMEQRPGTHPGQFKLGGNRAGSTIFVAPDLVEGTLECGFPFYFSLETAFQRAVFMMFLISEVHPFVDGNGRVARIMMNAELMSSSEERIIIPTVYRSNYLAALKALSLTNHPESLIRTLDFAQQWTHSIPWGDLHQTRLIIESCHALVDPVVADLEGIRLRLPHRVNA